MIIVEIFVNVKEEYIEDFRIATIHNAKNSVKEPGIVRFDVLQEMDDPTKFVLVEVYKDENAPRKHKETLHYQNWRDAVKDMMAIPRSSRKLKNVFPEDKNW